MRGELGPRHRLHLGGGVELHRARAERDHRPVEGHVVVGQPAQVAQHLGLGAVLVEHRVGEELAGAALGRRAGPSRGRVGRRRSPSSAGRGRSMPNASASTRPHGAGWSSRRARGRRVSPSTRRRLMPAAAGAARRASAAWPGTRTVSVSNHVSLTSSSPPARRPAARAAVEAVHAPGDAARPSGPWYTAYIDGHHGQQHLGGADVATWPSPGGCAARGSAGPGGSAGRPAASTDTPTRRPGSERL